MTRQELVSRGWTEGWRIDYVMDSGPGWTERFEYSGWFYSETEVFGYIERYRWRNIVILHAEFGWFYGRPGGCVKPEGE